MFLFFMFFSFTPNHKISWRAGFRRAMMISLFADVVHGHPAQGGDQIGIGGVGIGDGGHADDLLRGIERVFHLAGDVKAVVNEGVHILIAVDDHGKAASSLGLGGLIREGYAVELVYKQNHRVDDRFNGADSLLLEGSVALGAEVLVRALAIACAEELDSPVDAGGDHRRVDKGVAIGKAEDGVDAVMLGKIGGVEGERGFIHVRDGSNGLAEIRVVTENSDETFNRQPVPDRWFYEVQALAKLMRAGDYDALYGRLDIMRDVVETVENARRAAGILFPGD